MESGYQSFAESFHECCGASCTRLAYEHQQTDTDYAGRAQECDTLYKLIEEKLGIDYMLVNKFDAAKNHVFVLMMNGSINKAFKIACIYSVGLDFYKI